MQNATGWWDWDDSDDLPNEEWDIEDTLPGIPIEITDINITRLQGVLRLQSRMRERGILMEIGDLLAYFRPIP